MSITLESLRNVLDELNISHKFNREKNTIEFYINNCGPYDVTVMYLFISDKQNDLQAYGYLMVYDVNDSDDFNVAYRFCNQWNKDMLIPKVCVKEKDKMLVCEWTWNTDVELSEELFKKLIVLPFISTTTKCLEMAIQEGVYPAIPLTSKESGKVAREN